MAVDLNAVRECSLCDSSGWLHSHQVGDYVTDQRYTCHRCVYKRAAADEIEHLRGVTIRLCSLLELNNWVDNTMFMITGIIIGGVITSLLWKYMV